MKQNPSATKRLIGLVGVGVVSAALGAAPAFARSASAPQPANTAQIVSTLAGTTGTTPYQVSGQIDLIVQQVVNPGVTIGTANLNLPSGISMTSRSATVTSQEDGSGTCAGTPSFSWSGNTVTAKNLGCSDTDADGKVEFTLSVTVNSADSTLAAGSYKASSQYRSNPTRRTKENAWIVSNPTAVVVSANV